MQKIFKKLFGRLANSGGGRGKRSGWGYRRKIMLSFLLVLLSTTLVSFWAFTVLSQGAATENATAILRGNVEKEAGLLGEQLLSRVEAAGELFAEILSPMISIPQLTGNDPERYVTSNFPMVNGRQIMGFVKPMEEIDSVTLFFLPEFLPEGRENLYSYSLARDERGDLKELSNGEGEYPVSLISDTGGPPQWWVSAVVEQTPFWSKEEQTMVYSVPARAGLGASNRVVGVLSVRVRLEKLTERLEGLHFFASGRPWLLERDLTFAYHPDGKRRGRPLTDIVSLEAGATDAIMSEPAGAIH